MTRKKRHKLKTIEKPSPVEIPAKTFSGISPQIYFPFLIFILVFIFYIPAMKAGFLWDDELITDNLLLRSVQGLGKIWTDLTAIPQQDIRYWPLFYTWLWIQYQLWGSSALGYHLTNILLHGCNAVLLFFLLRKWKIKGAGIIAALFAMHPVHVESVAWVIESKTLLSTIFFLSSIYLYFHFIERNKWIFYGLSLILFVFALLTKPVTSILPFILLILLWWKSGTLSIKQLFLLIPFLIIAILDSALTLWLGQQMEEVKFGMNLLDKILIASRAVWFYMGKLFWPSPLMAIYPRWEMNNHTLLPYLYPLSLLLVLILLVYWKNKIGKGPLTAFLFFLISLAPILGFMEFGFMSYSFVADRYQYLASIGIIVLFMGIVIYCMEKYKLNKPVYQISLSSLILIIFGILTWQNSGYYRNSETLFQHNISENPKAWGAYGNLGYYYMNQGNYDKAKEYLAKALVIRPGYPEANNNFGLILANQGNMVVAKEAFLKALEIKPDFANAHNNLGVVYYQEGDLVKALDEFKKAVEFDPALPDAHFNLASLLLSQGQLDGAIEHFQLTLSIKQDYPQAAERLQSALNAKKLNIENHSLEMK